MAGGERLAALGQIPFDIPFCDQRQRDLLDLLARERFADVEQLVQQFHVPHDVGQPLVRVRRHEDQLDVAVDMADAAHRLDAVDARRHADVDEGGGDRPAGGAALRDRVHGRLAARRVQQLEIHVRSVFGLVEKARREVVGQRVRRAADKHLLEVGVDLPLVVDDQNPGVLRFLHIRLAVSVPKDLRSLYGCIASFRNQKATQILVVGRHWRICTIWFR